jgi:hypothetical protein
MSLRASPVGRSALREVNEDRDKIKRLTSLYNAAALITWDPGYLVALGLRSLQRSLRPNRALGPFGLGPVSCTGDR